MHSRLFRINGIRKVVGLSITLILLSGCASAPQIAYDYKVQADVEILTAYFTGWDGNCRSTYFRVKTVSAPRYGDIDVRDGTRKVSPGTAASSNQECIGSTVASKEIYYKSEPGFRGHDEFLVELSSPNSSGAQNYKVTVDVQ